MPLEIDFPTLEEAIAYEFFMENINTIMFPEGPEERTGEEIMMQVRLLACSAHGIASIFTAEHKKHQELINEQSTSNEVQS